MAHEAKLFSTQELFDFARNVFLAFDLPREDAELVADGLVEADLRGLASHGVARIPIYAERLRRQVVNPRPNISISQVAPVVASVDGDDGMGFVVGNRAMAKAIEMARDFGIGLVGVHRSTHYGMGAIYALQAIDAGMISLAFTNSSPAIPIWGGRNVFLGAAPFAAGAPGGERGPYVLDMAMTVIARGKIRLAAQRGDPIPFGLALDSEGHPTTDAKKAFEGVCLPFGGAKGAALSMLMDILCGVFTGAAYGGDVKSLYFDFSGAQNVGHFFLAMRPNLFISSEEFAQRMDTLTERVKASPRAAGVDEILMPGEPEFRSKEELQQTGIPLSRDIVDALREEAGKIGLPAPETMETRVVEV
jgi:LDH2 family malate/lactate/ureidoglycolate dehydrogenase